jgi:tRNA (cytidine/uridine-2'-O-)-methyltransferase
MLRLALYQPEIAQNAGTLIRLAAGLDVPVEIIEPMGFIWSQPKLRRAGMDYLDLARVRRHASWAAFEQARAAADPPGRLILLTTHGTQRHDGLRYASDDILLVGSESAGVPAALHDTADARVRIPLRREARSLNVAVAAAMVLGEALRQRDAFPRPDPLSDEPSA